MATETTTIVQRLWNYCHVLRDDGVSYGDYVEQLTYLLFLKMADEQAKGPMKKPSLIPEEYDWESLSKLGQRKHAAIQRGDGGGPFRRSGRDAHDGDRSHGRTGEPDSTADS